MSAASARAEAADRKSAARRRRWTWLRRLWSLSTGRFGLIVVAVVTATAIIARFWTPFDPRQVAIASRWALPGWPHLLGTDGTGRDILSLLMAGSRTTVLVAVGAGVIATVIGVALAALGALTARWLRESVAVLVDILIAFPGADHRDDDQRGVGRFARRRDLVGRHRVRREHRARHPTRAAPCAAQRLRAGRPRLRAHPAAEPAGAT